MTAMDCQVATRSRTRRPGGQSRAVLLLAVCLVFVVVGLPAKGVDAQAYAPVTPSVPTEVLDLYNFVVQTGAELIIKLGTILSNYLDSGLIAALNSMKGKREAESPIQSLMARLATGNGTRMAAAGGRDRFDVVRQLKMDKLRAFQQELVEIERQFETVISKAQMLQWLSAVHAARQGYTMEDLLAAEAAAMDAQGGNESEPLHVRRRRQTTLGDMGYGYVVGTTLQTLFAYLKQSLGHFTYLAAQLLNLYQVLPVDPGFG